MNLSAVATPVISVTLWLALPFSATSASAAWIALVNTNTGSVDGFTTGTTFATTNSQEIITLTDSQQLALHRAWPNCLYCAAGTPTNVGACVGLTNVLLIQTSFSNLTQTVNRDPLLVQEENFLKTAAQQVGIAATNTPAQMNALWTAAVAAATNTAQVISLVRQESKFWAFLSTLSLAVSGTSTTNITLAVPIWSPVP